MRMPARLIRFMMMCAGLFLLTSCISFRDIDVKDIAIDNLTMQGSKIVIDFSAMVHNPNRAFVIQSAEGDINRNQQHFAAAQLMQPIAIAAKCEQQYSGQIQLSLQSLLAMLQIGSDFTSLDMSSFLFTGNVQIKSACIKKKFTYREMPLNQLINSLK